MTDLLLNLPPSMTTLNPEQWAAVQAPTHTGVKVLAGAGTGKTKLIAHRFVKMVQELRTLGVEAPHHRILAVTFTDDAAKELKRRIHHQLLEVGESGLEDDAWISTFHTCCFRILQQHGALLGRSHPPVILDGLQQTLLFRQLLQAIKEGKHADIRPLLAKYQLAERVPADILSLSALQRLPLEGISDLLDRVPKVIQRIKAAGLSPAAFLQQASQQSQGFTQGLQTLPLAEPYTGEPFESLETYGQLWQKHLTPWAAEGWNLLQATRDLLEPKEADYKAALDFIAKPLRLFTYDRSKKRYLPNVPDFSALEAITAIESEITQLVAAVYVLYQEALLAQNACDFDGLINQTLQLLSEYPEVREHYRERFEAIIVDEFQDSNGSQLQLLKLLMRETSPNLTVVGDEKQAIYGFRFAQRENLALIFQDREHQFITLQTNYRSKPPILAVANQLTQALTQHPQALLPAPQYQGTEAPSVTWLTLGRPLESPEGAASPSPKVSYEPIGVLKQRESRLMASEIARLCSQEGYRYGDIAVLAKGHQKLQQIQQVLWQAGIPAVCKKNIGFFQEPVIKDAMACFRLLVNPHEDLALLRLLQGKLNQRQLKDLVLLRRTLNHTSLFETLGHLPALLEETDQPLLGRLSPPVLEALSSLIETLKLIRSFGDQLSPVQLFQRLAKSLGFIHPDEEDVIQQQKAQQLRIFEKLLYAIQSTSLTPMRLADVLEVLQHYQENPTVELPLEEASSETEAVQLMTIHGAKGLEFPVVFVAYTEDAKPAKLEDSLLLFDPQFPGKAGFGLMLGKYRGETTLKKEVYRTLWHLPRLQEEEKRLFYVALTRAQERLYVLRARQSVSWTAAEQFKNPALQAWNEEQHPEYFEAFQNP